MLGWGLLVDIRSFEIYLACGRGRRGGKVPEEVILQEGGLTVTGLILAGFECWRS